jgi:polyphosphate kinase 2 (PPK2 family)
MNQELNHGDHRVFDRSWSDSAIFVLVMESFLPQHTPDQCKMFMQQAPVLRNVKSKKSSI